MLKRHFDNDCGAYTLIVSLHIIGMSHVKNIPSGGSSFSHGNANAPGAGTNPLFCQFFRKNPHSWSWKQTGPGGCAFLFDGEAIVASKYIQPHYCLKLRSTIKFSIQHWRIQFAASSPVSCGFMQFSANISLNDKLANALLYPAGI